MNELKMMFTLLRISAKSQVMYRADFIIGFIGTLFYNAVFLASIGIITASFKSIGGFSAWQMVFLYAMFELAHSWYGFFLQNMASYLNKHVVDGTLDVYFLRPYSILTQLNGSKMNFTGFVDAFIGLVCMIMAYINLGGLHWNIAQILLLVVFVVSGGFIEFGLSLIMNCATILYPNTKSLYGAYYQFVLISQRYPLNIFARGFRGILTFVFPLGFINYYPSLLLLGKPGGWVGYFTPLAALCITGAGIGLFNLTIREYSSSGN
jgi:ABC-2 type transport system permease protein